MPSIDLSRYEKKKVVKPAIAKENGGILAFLNRDISFGGKELADKKKRIPVPGTELAVKSGD